MGNALCGIVPTDMVCNRDEQIQFENEKNLISLNHYNSQIVDKKLAGISLFNQMRNNRPNDENEERGQMALSMPVRYTIEHPDKPLYSLNEKDICVTWKKKMVKLH